MDSKNNLSADFSMESGPLSLGNVPHSKKVDFLVDFISGTVGGTASVFVGQPLDTVKVKLQTFPSLYKNALDCTMKTFRTDGLFRGLYAGTIPSLVAQVSENAILFMAYGQCQKVVMYAQGKSNVNQLNVSSNALAGGMAAIFSAFALCPTELVKCRLQAMQEMVSMKKSQGGVVTQVQLGPWSLTKSILKEEGILGLYRGLTATFMREIPANICFFGAYEMTKCIVVKEGQRKDELRPLQTIVCGAASGIVCWTVTFPADVVKSRAQVNQSSKNFTQILFHIIKTEGVRALYRGLGPTLLRTAPATGALFLAVENSKKLFNNAIQTNSL